MAISLSLPVAIGLAVFLVCIVGWSFFMGLMVGRGQNPQVQIEAMTGDILKHPPEAESPEPELPEAAPEEQASAPEPAPSPVNQPFTRPEGTGMEAWSQAPAATAPAPKKPPAPPVKKADKPKAPSFEYTLQIAVFKNLRDAEKLRATLQGKGIRCRIKKSGNAQLLLNTLRGSESDFSALQKKLAGLKLGRPLVLSKKPVDKQPPKKQRKK